MGQRQLRRYVLPGPGSVNTRTYPTSVPEGDYLMLRNLDIPQNLGAFVTRKGYNLISNIGFAAIRNGVRFYYGSVNSQLIIAAGNGSFLQFWLWGGGNTWTFIPVSPTMTDSTGIVNFPFSQDKLFILNGVDPVQRWDGTTPRKAGFPAPVSAPLSAVGAAGVLTGSYQWVVTFVYDGNPASESSASGPSTPLVLAVQQGALTIPTGPAGCTARNIYRTLAGGTLFQFVSTVSDNVTTSVNDNTPDTSLGTNQAPTDNNAPPAGAMFGVFYRGRFVVARTPTNPQRVFMSAITNTEKSPGGGGLSLHGNGIEIFPTSHFIDVGDDNTPITGLAVIADQLVIFKQNRVYNLQGDDAQDMTVWVGQGETGCIAPKSIQNVGNSIIFLGRSDGVPTVYAYDGYQAQPLSTPIEPTLKANINQLGWTDQASLNSQPTGFHYRGQYVIVYCTSVVNQQFEAAVIDMRPPQPRWQFLDFGPAGLAPACFIPFNGPNDTGQLFFGENTFGEVFQWDVGWNDIIILGPPPGNNVTATILTKPMDLGAPGIWKQVHRIEVEGFAVAGSTVQVDRAYNRSATFINGTALPLSAPVDDKLYLSLARAVQDCAGADDTQANPEQGELVQLRITLVSGPNAQAEVSKIILWVEDEPASETRRPA